MWGIKAIVPNKLQENSIHHNALKLFRIGEVTSLTPTHVYGGQV